ncbi:unnamed protein product [Parnassius mnemosyne]|uniref:CST complex subunit Stn1 N-terminal domain-containing protein n=1 Tax=Parnassius mnemosyne TaxID=213953 RepID=A0AAV1LLZ9_9NEOP
MDNIQKHPLKLYIQDIFRAKQTVENKYIYEIFGIKFKNIMVHGIVTAVYNKCSTTTNLEISDATASVQVYYDTTKSNNNLSNNTIKELLKDFAKASKYHDDNLNCISSLLDLMIKKKDNIMNFIEGDYVSVVGDIFVDEIRNIRMLSAYECKPTSIERDVVWMEELRYLYENFYLWNKISDNTEPPEIT